MGRLTKNLGTSEIFISSNGYYYGSCTLSKYYDVYLRIGSYWTVVNPKDYIIPFP